MAEFGTPQRHPSIKSEPCFTPQRGSLPPTEHMLLDFFSQQHEQQDLCSVAESPLSETEGKNKRRHTVRKSKRWSKHEVGDRLKLFFLCPPTPIPEILFNQLVCRCFAGFSVWSPSLLLIILFFPQ